MVMSSMRNIFYVDEWIIERERQKQERREEDEKIALTNLYSKRWETVTET